VSDRTARPNFQNLIQLCTLDRCDTAMAWAVERCNVNLKRSTTLLVSKKPGARSEMFDHQTAFADAVLGDGVGLVASCVQLCTHASPLYSCVHMLPLRLLRWTDFGPCINHHIRLKCGVLGIEHRWHGCVEHIGRFFSIYRSVSMLPTN